MDNINLGMVHFSKFITINYVTIIVYWDFPDSSMGNNLPAHIRDTGDLSITQMRFNLHRFQSSTEILFPLKDF